MTIVATRGNLALCDNGDGTGYLESKPDVVRPLDSFLKWGYWKPVDAREMMGAAFYDSTVELLMQPVTAASGPLPGEGPLVRKYEAILERNAKRCKRNYLRSSRVVTAAGEEQNRNPLLGEVLDEGALAESATSVKAQQQKIAEEAARQAALEMGISFAVVSPFVKDLVLAQAGRQAERIVAGVRELVASIILRSIQEGWSVPQTADEIYQGLGEAKKWQATMLARTDLIAMGNGGSFAAASALGDAAPKYKQWKNADDEKVRPTHVEAEDQVVPLASPFTVGGASLMFPGDPSGPDDEVINCRCTLVYTDNPQGLAAAGFDPAKHPRHPAGSERGGQWRAHLEGESSEFLQQVAAHNDDAAVMAKTILQERGVPEQTALERWEQASQAQREQADYLKRMWESEPGMENDFHSEPLRAWADQEFGDAGRSTLPDDWQKGWTWGEDALAVDRAIYEQNPLSEDIAVWRGAYGETGEPSSRPISTSFSKYVAGTYADRSGSGSEKHLHRVLVPAGSHVGWHTNEDEIVLPTGTVLENAGPNLWVARVPEQMVDEQTLRAALVTAAGFDESKHPHVPAGSSKGGQWAETSDPHALDDNPPQEEIKRSWDDLYGRSLNWESDEYVNAPKPPWAGDRFGPGQVYHDAQFTADQHQAMEHYQGSGYASVNHLLRDPADFHARVAESRKNSASQVWDMLTAYNGETPEQIEASVMAQVNDLDSSLRPNPTPVTAYRINHLAWDDPPTMEAVKDVYGEIGPDIVGKTVVDPAFQSTTLDKAWADRRADSSGGTRAILHRIHVPAGVPAIYMPSAHPSMSFDEEEELTLGRDTPMRAVGYEERPDGTKVIDWEVVGW